MRWSIPSLPMDLVLVTCPKLELFTLPFGVPKCGVFVAFNASPRNWNFNQSVIEKVRNKPKSRFAEPGARSRSKDAVPNRGSVTGAKRLVSKYVFPTPMLPVICTGVLPIRSARCVLPGAFKDVPDAVTLKGLPE